MRVLARWQGNTQGGYWRARVVGDNNDGTYSIKYDDGDADTRVPVWYKGRPDPEIKHADGAYVDCPVKIARCAGMFPDEVHSGFKCVRVEAEVEGEEDVPRGMKLVFDYDWKEVDAQGREVLKEQRSVTLDNIVLEEDPLVAGMHYRALFQFMELLYTTPPVSKEDMQRLLGQSAGEGWSQSEAQRIAANFEVFRRARDAEEEKRKGAGSGARKRRK